MSPGRWCCVRRHRTAKRENKTFGGVIVSTLTKHRTYSGYDLFYILHTLRYVCPLRTLFWMRLRSINSRARNFTVSYVHSYQVQKNLFANNLFSFFAATMAWSGFGPYHGMWHEYAQTKCICAWLGLTCRRHVSPTAKSWHFWPTRPSRADTNSFPTLFLCRGLPTFSKCSISTRGTYGVIIVQTGMYKY
jgi:hypothetical protein